jgi:glycerol kinase
MYAVEGIIHSSAATIEWLRKQLGLFESAAECEQLANDVPDNGGVYLVPAFGGLGAPHWAPEARAAIVGLSAHSTKAHIARSAVESIAFQVADALDLIRTESGVAPTSLRVDGGASRNRMLLQLIADLSGLWGRVADGSALGASMLGAIAIGQKIEPNDAGTIAIEPAMGPDQVRAMRIGWNRAVRQVLASKGD